MADQPDEIIVIAVLGACDEETAAKLVAEITDVALRNNVNAVIEPERLGE